jgi:hypothetical protein
MRWPEPRIHRGLRGKESKKRAVGQAESL